MAWALQPDGRKHGIPRTSSRRFCKCLYSPWWTQPCPSVKAVTQRQIFTPNWDYSNVIESYLTSTDPLVGPDFCIIIEIILEFSMYRIIRVVVADEQLKLYSVYKTHYCGIWVFLKYIIHILIKRMRLELLNLSAAAFRQVNCMIYLSNWHPEMLCGMYKMLNRLCSPWFWIIMERGKDIRDFERGFIIRSWMEGALVTKAAQLTSSV